MASAKNELPINSSRKLPIANPQRRLSERSIFWYPVTGGGLGVISAALIYRHKTLYKALLAQAAPTKTGKLLCMVLKGQV
jgi:uncharacterized membrane protein YsdA (DUF1294 family)